MEREADFGGLLSETFSLLGDGIRGIAMYVLVIGGLSAFGLALGLATPDNDFGISWGFMIDASSNVSAALFDLGLTVVSIVASYLLATHLLAVRGRLPDPSTRIWAYVGLTILWGIGVVIGFILLIFPGIFLMVRWSATTGYLIGGRRDIGDCFSASWKATEGSGWSIFFAGLVLAIAMGVVGSVFGGLTLFSGGGSSLGLGFLGAAAFVDAFSNAMFVAFSIAVYVLADKGGEEIGEVFA